MYWNTIYGLKSCNILRRLIETWDVLKSGYRQPLKNVILRLIETWDVLK